MIVRDIDDNEIHRYRICLYYLNRRLSVIYDHLYNNDNLRYIQIEAEFLCLQFRLVLELILHLSMIANIDNYSRENINYHEWDRFKKILNRLRTINSDFFPKPVLINYNINFSEVNIVIKNDKICLTEIMILNIYNDCNNMLHENNPYKDRLDNKEYFSNFKTWYTLIRNLMFDHVIYKNDQNTGIVGTLNYPNSNSTKSKEAVYYITRK